MKVGDKVRIDIAALKNTVWTDEQVDFYHNKIGTVISIGNSLIEIDVHSRTGVPSTFWLEGELKLVETTPSNTEQRIERALEYAFKFGQIGGDHHKTWVIDQMVRALTGCGIDTETQIQGSCNEYYEWLKKYNDGEEGPNTYSWDVGIAP